MKLLPNINKSVPEASDPALIKPVSDAIEALDTALGAPLSTLTTGHKTLVGAINEIVGDPRDFKAKSWTINTDANTIGRGIFTVEQQNDWATLNYPASHGILVSFGINYFGFQIFARQTVADIYVRTGNSPTTWTQWKTLTST